MEAGARGKTYKIGQAAKLLDVKPFVLRFWEGEFKDVLVPVRTPSGQRAYTEGNVELVREIKRLLYDEGLTIEGAKKRLREAKPGTRPAVQTGALPSGYAQAGSAQPSGPTSAQPGGPASDHPSGIPSGQTPHPAPPAPAQPARAAEATARADEAATLAAARAAATARAEVATARADALAQALTHFRQELLAIRDLLG